MFLNSPTRREGVGPVLCLPMPCRDPALLPLSDSVCPICSVCSVCSQVSGTPEDFAFAFPHFLLLLKETFNPASLLDHAWQKFEDLLKTGDNEQKQEDRLWRKRAGLEASSFMQIHCKMFSHSWAEVACNQDVPALDKTRFRGQPQKKKKKIKKGQLEENSDLKSMLMNLSISIVKFFFWDERKLLTIPAICVFNKLKLCLWDTVICITYIGLLCHMSKQLRATIVVRFSVFQSYDRSSLLLFIKLKILGFWFGGCFFVSSTNLLMIFLTFFFSWKYIIL